MPDTTIKKGGGQFLTEGWGRSISLPEGALEVGGDS